MSRLGVHSDATSRTMQRNVMKTATASLRRESLHDQHVREHKQDLLTELSRKLRDELIQGRFRFPILPEKAARLLALVNQPDFSLRDLMQLLAKDPLMSARVLSVANSAIYARPVIASVQAACLRLGVRQLRDVVIEAVAGAHLFVGMQRTTLAVELVHSSLVAIVSRKLSELVHEFEDTSFACGLLHDVGRPITWQALAADPDLTLDLDARRTLVDALHPLVGERLAKRWNLPDPIAEVARYHHYRPEIADEARLHPLVVRISLVDRLAKLVAGREDNWLERSQQLLERTNIGLTQHDIDALIHFTVEMERTLRSE